jgi:hypothetical protein
MAATAKGDGGKELTNIATGDNFSIINAQNTLNKPPLAGLLDGDILKFLVAIFAGKVKDIQEVKADFLQSLNSPVHGFASEIGKIKSGDIDDIKSDSIMSSGGGAPG